MAHPKITLFGMEKFLNDQSDSLFKDLTLPTGVNKDIFINQLMLTGGEFALLYMDPTFMKSMTTHWSLKNLVPFTRIFEAYNKSYDPLSNYDRTESYDDSEISSGNSSHDNQSTLVNTLHSDSETVGSATASSDDATVNKVSAYDDAGFSNHDKSEGTSRALNSNQNKTLGTENSSNIGNENGSMSSNNSRTASHLGRIFGNVGVTTSQSMLEAELNLRSKFNPYDMMVDSYIQEFLIPVYA